MGYVMMFGNCCACGRQISFNPNKVPSIRIEGERRPVCKACIDAANSKRKEMGLPLFEIDPEAYEPANEDEIAWE